MAVGWKKNPISGSRVCEGPTEGGQTVGEKPPGQILGNLGADGIFEFLAMYHVETPLSTSDVETPPLSTSTLDGKSFPTYREFQGRWDDGVEPISRTVWGLFWSDTLL